MRNIYALLVALTAIAPNKLDAQNSTCGSDALRHHKLEIDDQYRNERNLIEEQIIESSGSLNKTTDDSVIVIPVVFHIIHKGEAVGAGSNISEQKIYNCLKGVNDRFRGRLGFGVDVGIEFCLAKRDPNNKPTNGIVRVDGSGVTDYTQNGIDFLTSDPAASEKEIKDLSKWPTTKYYNIWVVWNVYGPDAYATYPGQVTNDYDGAVITAGGISYQNSLTTHELGHAFNLIHVFDRIWTSCFSDTACDRTGDRVCDTPPMIDLGNGSCPLVYPCESQYPWDNTRKNIMGSCGAQDRFTQGQKDRMRACFSITNRGQLKNSIACQPVRQNEAELTNLTYCDSLVSAEIRNNGANKLSNVVVGWSLNGVAQSPVKWTGNLLYGETESILLGKYSGSYKDSVDVKVWLSTTNGVMDSYTQNDSTLDSFRCRALVAGSYSVGDKNSDFISFSELEHALVRGGVCGQVVINIQTGTYDISMNLVDVKGLSQTNNIVFQSQSGNKDDVILRSISNNVVNNYIFRLRGTSFITFDKITMKSENKSSFTRILDIGGGASNIEIVNCRFFGCKVTWRSSSADAVIYSDNSTNSECVVKYNEFVGGSYGVYLEGGYSREYGTIVDSNSFYHQSAGGVYLSYQSAPRVRGNKIKDASLYGIIINDSEKELWVSGNRITGVTKTGIKLDRLNASDESKAVVANNFISVGNGVRTTALNISNSNFVQLIHNSLQVLGEDSLGKALYNFRSVNIGIFNSILCSKGKGYAIYLQLVPDNGMISDHNVLYTNGTRCGFSGNQNLTFAGWQQLGFDSNSMFTDPRFHNDSMLYTCLDTIRQVGTSKHTLKLDIDGNQRDSQEVHPGAALIGSPDVVDLGKDRSISASDSVRLDGGVFNTYHWSTGDTVRYLLVRGEDIDSSMLIWVEVTDSGGCRSSDSILINLKTTGIGNPGQSQLKMLVYPNPAKSIVRVELEGSSTISQYQFLSDLGILIESGSFQNEFILYVDDYRAGMYILTITTADGEVLRTKVFITNAN